VNLATEVSGRYDGLNHFVYTEDDGTVLTGLNIEVTASEEVLAGNVVGDSTIYFGVEAGQVLLAIANSGDIDGIGFCDNSEYAPQ
jgi:outer membrane protein assembly factor BamB